MRKSVLILLLCLLLLLSGCKGNNSEGTDTPAVNEGVPELNIIAEDDSLDPENTESELPEGGEVSAADLYHESGRANGIDISKWQGRIDWKKVAADGIDFAIIRIGYRGENGTIYRDANADYNIQQATAAGIPVGVYFFSTAVSAEEAREEAVWTANAIAGYKISYPVVYDCEGFNSASSRMYSLTASQRTDNAIAFLDYIKNAGYEGMFYGAKNDLQNISVWETSRIEASFKVWVAQYTTPAYPQTQKPDYKGRYDMWQYTNRGTVDGVEGNCDMILSYFVSEKAEAKDASKTPATAKPPKTQEELLYTDVNDTVTAKEVVNLREGPSTKYNVVGTLKSGEFLTRTGKGSNGWSKLNFNGKTVYAITSYLSNEVIKTPERDIVNGAEFTPASDRVTAKSEVNLRSQPTTDSEIVGTLKSGTFLSRTATGSNGWSRLDFGGKTVYAVTSYLTTTAPEIDPNAPHKPEGDTTEHGMVFTPSHSNVTAKEETNLRDKPTTDGSTVIHTLKNGEYIEKVAESTAGWSKLIYNGQTVYAVTSFLTE